MDEELPWDHWDPPLACDNDHALETPNAAVGWTPCECPKARLKPSGHRRVICWTCGWEWREGGCDELPAVQPVRVMPM